jgi:hypothetical protein
METKTMDSREIARLCKKRHDNVMRDIKETLGELPGGVLRFEHTYRNQQNGQEYRCYLLPYRETMILVSGYSVELRAKVVDRWMVLEQREASRIASPAASTPALPCGTQLRELRLVYGAPEAAKRIDHLIGYPQPAPIVPAPRPEAPASPAAAAAAFAELRQRFPSPGLPPGTMDKVARAAAGAARAALRKIEAKAFSDHSQMELIPGSPA